VAVAGFCGAVDPALRPGDLVVATEARAAWGRVICPSAGLISAALRNRGLRCRLGSLLSIDHVARRDERRRRRDRGVLAVDMESAWLLDAAGDRPVAVLRAVVDDADHGIVSTRTPARALRALAALRCAAPVLGAWAAAAGDRQALLASPRSFCAGVERAIEVVNRALDRFGPPVYVRKQIVHNSHVVSELEERGAVFVGEVSEVPPGCVVVFSAHGVAPGVREEAARRSLRVIDATCPLVGKVHAEARRFAADGRTILLIGHHGHEEVEGTTGEAPDAVRLVQGVGDVAGLEVEDPERLAYLTQTTLSLDETDEIVAALRERFPALAAPPSEDICYATQNRQDALKAVAPRCDAVLVVGSANSSNSRRLVEVSERLGTPAHLIDDETDLDVSWLAGRRRIGLTAGASASETLVDRVIRALVGLGKVEIMEETVAEESVRFQPPKGVRAR
jgi:4-hydroxy-3-methylbut-2-enyl diphosphate reductase